MNKSLLATIVTGLLLSTVPAVAPVEATSAIQRCQSPDGTLVYTDKACANFGAKAVPMPDALMTRIVHEVFVHEEAMAPADAGGYADASMPLDQSVSSIPVSPTGATSTPVSR